MSCWNGIPTCDENVTPPGFQLESSGVKRSVNGIEITSRLFFRNIQSCTHLGFCDTSSPVNIIAKYARNVKDYGAKCDGLTDDTQAFIQALQSARADSQPNWYGPLPVTVYVPPGRYLISSTLAL